MKRPPITVRTVGVLPVREAGEWIARMVLDSMRQHATSYVPPMQSPVVPNSTRLCTIKQFCAESGYTDDGVRAKISSGVWVKNDVWLKAPDGRILIDRDAFERWTTHGSQVPKRRRPSTDRGAPK